MRYTVSHDTIEALVWGQNLQLGYDKNPYLIGWITHFILKLGSYSIIAYYLLQQVWMALGFWSVWKLGNLLFNPYKAFIATVILQACLYFTVYTQTNNDNYLLIGLWSLSAYTFFLAYKTELRRYWLITGLALGLACMAKYSSLLFAAALLLFLIFQKDRRNVWQKPGIYMGILVAFAICLPNFIWLCHNNFISLRYIFYRGNSDYKLVLFGHPDYILEFGQKLLFDFLGAFILFALTMPKWSRSAKYSWFLCAISVFPILVIMLVALIMGQKIYWEWGVPFVIFWGLVLVNFLEPSESEIIRRRLGLGVAMTLCITVCAYVFDNCYLRPGKGTGDYPGRQVATYVTDVWETNFHKPLRYVAGSRFVAGYVSLYSEDKPKVYVEWEDRLSPGVSEKDIKKYGAIFVQDGEYGVGFKPEGYNNPGKFPDSVIKKYPNLIILPIQIFPYNRSVANSSNVDLLVGILPPNSK